MTDTQRLGRHRQAVPQRNRTPVRRHRARLAAAAGVAVAIVVAFAVYGAGQPAKPGPALIDDIHGLPTAPGSYIGLYERGMPPSYAGLNAFTTATGVRPDVLVIYSSWLEPFQTGFATTAAQHGAVPLVQINPFGVSIAAIASGQYDGYLRSYAEAVRAYRHPVILSFGHEMNGNWYSWGNGHTSPAVFVAAWRHIVTLFRESGARNVTWLWTVNVMHTGSNISRPEPWWPGSKYVTWVGVDGYYYKPSWKFAPLFGPTIAAIRQFTHAPMLIAETSAAPTTNQPAKIADLFAGVRLYGLLGFVWFNSVHNVDWRLTSPTAIAAFRRGAQMYRRTES